MLPLLDGRRTVPELVDELGASAERAIENAIELLARHEAITNGPPIGPEVPLSVRETAELLSANGDGSAPFAILKALASSRVGIAGNGAPADDIARLLRSSGVAEVESMPVTGAGDVAARADLVVAAPAPHEQPELLELNALALATRAPWLQILAFDGVFAAVGPLFVPHESCCHACYLARRAANVPCRGEFELLSKAPAPYPESPAVGCVVAGLAATLALRWLSHRDPALPGILHALDYHPSPRLTRHVVHRVPRCEACSPVTGLATPFPWSEDAGG